MIIRRLRTEDCNRTKNDSNFSEWKILIGPSDWEDYSKGKEGSARYRIHNLPEKSGPGVYELGIAASSSGLGREIYKLAPNRIVVVYLGQADNVRARLQRYGRTGAHLGNSCKADCSDDSSIACHQKGQLLFQEIFSQGYPIIYRWAPMQNKEDAKRTEDQLLSTFDYAWNKSNNGARRHDDILQRLNKIASGTRTFSDMAMLLLPFTQKKAGIRIKSSELFLTDKELHEAHKSSNNFLSQVFKFNRSRPRIVQDITGVIQEDAKLCGVALDDGSVCRRPPAEKRLRCPEHKGMKENVSTAKAIRAQKSGSILELEPNIYCQTKGNGYGKQNVGHDVEDPLQIVVESPVDESITNICGIILNDGSPCSRQPVKGRKRCPEHKGMRINVSIAKAIRVSKSESIVKQESRAYMSPVDESIINICGIILNNGSLCRRQPVKGRKRCPEHTGMRINMSTAKAIRVPKSESIVKQESSAYTSLFYESINNMCGIILNNGSPCRRQPAKGRKRCHEHKGKRI